MCHAHVLVPWSYARPFACVALPTSSLKTAAAAAAAACARAGLFEAAGGGQVVQNMAEVAIGSEEELLRCMRAAQTQRRVGSTSSNDRSSRSHLIFTLYVDTWHRPLTEQAHARRTRPRLPAPRRPKRGRCRPLSSASPSRRPRPAHTADALHAF
eukprot:2049237-Prymnesium_polylepis.2